MRRFTSDHTSSLSSLALKSCKYAVYQFLSCLFSVLSCLQLDLGTELIELSAESM